MSVWILFAVWSSTFKAVPLTYEFKDKAQCVSVFKNMKTHLKSDATSVYGYCQEVKK